MAGQMKRHWCGEAQGINAIHHAAVTFNQVTVIFEAAIAFDGRHDKATAETHEGDDQ